MFFFVYNTAVIFFTLNFLRAYGEHQVPVARMLYAYEASIHDFPFYASVGPCGAAILNPNWYLTTAHCIPREVIPGKNFVFVGGEFFNTSVKYAYDKIYIHPDVDIKDHRIPFNDIGLVYRRTNLEYTQRINKIKLPVKNQPATEDPYYTVVGRGIDETGAIAQRLMKMNVVRVTIEDCLNDLPREYWHIIWPHIKLLEKNFICATRVVDSPGLCYRDSGSPMIQNDILIGLASFIGKPCHNSRMGFYVNVSSYMDWIWDIAGLYK